MKILVTGGAGFIGSNFINYWLKNHPKDKIINLDKLTYAGHLSSLEDITNINYKFVKGDICDTKLVDSIMKEVDYVVHFAAESHVDRSITGPSIFIQTNIVGTHVLLESALKYKIKRFHHISTDEVFGSLDLDSNDKFNENTIYNPRSPYSASKASSDHLVRAYYHTFGLPITISNCSNNFGPYQDPEKFLSRMITNLIDGKKIPIYGDGKNVRDWLYVEDHVRAIEKVLLSGKLGETYLVGGQTDDLNNIEIAELIIKIFGSGEIEFVKDRLGHDRKYSVDWSKINKELGWKPKFNIKEGLQKTVDWYKDNEKWWRILKAQTENYYNGGK